jgi:glycosyltransferase involved in cell wall biosynthesis
MSKSLSILQVARWGVLKPEYGGPPVVLNQLTNSLTKFGHRVDVVTVDPPSSPWLAELPGHVIALGPGTGRYGYSRRFRRWLTANVQHYDAVIVHGIYGYHSYAVRQACSQSSVDYHVFIHGALDPWFKKRYPLKHIKKWLYWNLSEHKSLAQARSVIFTSENERDLARQSFKRYRLRESVIALGIDEPDGDPASQRETFFARFPELRDKRIFLFLSRLHPKKGCDLLIKAFAQVADSADDLHLVLAGPDECGLEQQLRELSNELGIGDRVTWPGMLTGEAKWGAYRAADAFVLISHSENFGLVIAEALACGLPVLTTDKVNIHRELLDSGGVLIGTDTVDSAVSMLRTWLDKSVDERDVMRQRARSFYLNNFGADTAATGLLRLVGKSNRLTAPQ